MLHVFPLDHDFEYCRRRTLERHVSDGDCATGMGGLCNNA
jgi:hypothetical protein